MVGHAAQPRGDLRDGFDSGKRFGLSGELARQQVPPAPEVQELGGTVFPRVVAAGRRQVGTKLGEAQQVRKPTADQPPSPGAMALVRESGARRASSAAPHCVVPVFPAAIAVGDSRLEGEKVDGLVLHSHPQLLGGYVEANLRPVGDRRQVVLEVIPRAVRKDTERARRLELALQGITRAISHQETGADVRLRASVVNALNSDDELREALRDHEVIEFVGAAGWVVRGPDLPTNFLGPTRLFEGERIVLEIPSDNERAIEEINELRSSLKELSIPRAGHWLARHEVHRQDVHAAPNQGGKPGALEAGGIDVRGGGDAGLPQPVVASGGHGNSSRKMASVGLRRRPNSH